LVNEISLYYDVRSTKHQKATCFVSRIIYRNFIIFLLLPVDFTVCTENPNVVNSVTCI
jgi:hypothetical protein